MKEYTFRNMEELKSFWKKEKTRRENSSTTETWTT